MFSTYTLHAGVAKVPKRTVGKNEDVERFFHERAIGIVIVLEIADADSLWATL